MATLEVSDPFSLSLSYPSVPFALLIGTFQSFARMCSGAKWEDLLTAHSFSLPRKLLCLFL